MSIWTPTPQFDYAAQWAAESEGEELQLPSGKTVLVRTPDVLTMAKQGLIPDHLTPIVEQFIFDKEATIARINGNDAQGEPIAQAPGEKLAGYALYMRYVDVVVVGACVAPIVRFDPKPGEIGPEQISTTDRIAIWTWAEGLTGMVAQFPDGRDGADADVQPLADGEEPEPAA